MKHKSSNQKDTFHLTIQGCSLEVQRIPGSDSQAAELVFLHEGLGSVSHWKDFPAQVGAITGCPVTVYSRYGCGDSDVLTEPRTVSYLHEEGLRTLPDLLAELQIENPILVGAQRRWVHRAHPRWGARPGARPGAACSPCFRGGT